MRQTSQNYFSQLSVVLIGSVLSLSVWAIPPDVVDNDNNQPAHFINSSDTLTVATWGDVDGDGDTDAWTFGNPATIWLNDGNGEFLPLTGKYDTEIVDTFEYETDPHQSETETVISRSDGLNVSFGDLDGDGDMDAWVNYKAFTSFCSRIICPGRGGFETQRLFKPDPIIWLNNGQGTYTQKPETLGIGRQSASQLIDLDGDNDLDVLSTPFNTRSSSIAVYTENEFVTIGINDGQANFQFETLTFPRVSDVRQIFPWRIADVDQDGDLDFTFWDHIALNDGNGTFALKEDLVQIGQSKTDSDKTNYIPFDGFADDQVIFLSPPVTDRNSRNSGVLGLVRGEFSFSHFNVKFHQWVGQGDSGDQRFSYLVLSEGIHSLPGGVVLEVGRFRSERDWYNHHFRANFAEPPVVLLTAQNMDKPAVARAKQVTRTGFKAKLFAEEAKEKTGATTVGIIGYLAIYSPTGQGYLPVGNTELPFLLQRVKVDDKFTPVLSGRLRMIEDQSYDEEISHIFETVNVLAVGPHLFAQDISSQGGNPATLQMESFDRSPVEWGQVGGVTHEWTRVPLVGTYTEPVIVANALTRNGGQPGVIRLRNIKPDSFEMRFAEWDYLDGLHKPEDVSFLVADTGCHPAGNLTHICAGKRESDKLVNQREWETVTPPHRGLFLEAVFGAVQTENDSETVTARVQSLPAYIIDQEFTISMVKQESSNSGHATETLGWVGINTSGDGFGNLGNRLFSIFQLPTVSSSPEIPQVKYHINPTDTFIGAISSINGLNPATVRFTRPQADSIEVFLEEERSKDNEIYHVNETVSIFVGS